jgi:hypothetical protein
MFLTNVQDLASFLASGRIVGVVLVVEMYFGSLFPNLAILCSLVNANGRFKSISLEKIRF